MKREWKPGDVAASTYGPVFLTEKGWIFDDASGYVAVGEPISEGPRPLVVIDPEDREQVERLAQAIGAHDSGVTGDVWTGDLAAALREFVNPTPPKPAEPTGLGAVVEDAEGRAFVRVDVAKHPWHYGSAAHSWHEIAAVRVLSEGVTP